MFRDSLWIKWGKILILKWIQDTMQMYILSTKYKTGIYIYKIKSKCLYNCLNILITAYYICTVKSFKLMYAVDLYIK